MSFDFCALCINMNTKIWYVFIKICFVCMTFKKKKILCHWLGRVHATSSNQGKGEGASYARFYNKLSDK